MSTTPSDDQPDGAATGDSGSGGREEERRREPDLFTGVMSRLLAGPLAFGLIGKGLDNWWGTSFMLPVGLIGGVALALYVVWLRYGTT